MKKVTILGCGPSGLLAAAAYASEGWDVTILSKKQQSLIGGAQYLHRHIPEVTKDEPEGEATYLKIGTRDGYAEKVYGTASAPVSWDLYDAGTYDIWSLRGIYSRLWEMFEDRIRHVSLDHEMIRSLVGTGLIVSSIPANHLCQARHDFRFQSVWILQQPTREASMPENLIEYNGDPDFLHYRRSRIFGVEGWEFAHPSAAEFDGVVHVRKPISTNCDCLGGIQRVGRYGRWEKSQLAHHAYEQSLEVARAL
jgi:hypothetical protein